MRKRYRVLILAAIVAAIAVPVGFALSLESQAPPPAASVPVVVAMIAPSALVKTAPVPMLAGVPDSAKLFVMGTMLFGLAFAVRRALDVHSRSLVAAPQAYNRDVSAR